MKPREIVVNDLMQQQYCYRLTEPAGRNFHAGFEPQLTPKEMLKLGVFGGRYMTDCTAEFPDDWFEHARLCHERHDPELNFFKINASLPLPYGGKRSGSTSRTRAAGSSGTAGTGWGGAARTTNARSGAGRR